ncbi:MAG: extracellular solute-binding protein [Anaerolineae bacterium]|nr:extracellular solute-binding protein [Anaerolineae bacterium]
MKASHPVQIYPVRYRARPLYLVGLVLSMALRVTSGCASGPPMPFTPSITIVFACRDNLRSVYESLAQAFCASHPEIEVEIVSWDEIIGESDPWSPKAVARLVTRADVAIAPTRFGPSVTRQGLLRDLTPLMEADPSFEPEDFWPGVLDAYRWDGGTWALPSHISLWLLLYDADAFDIAGIAYPQSDWSREDFLTAAEALTLRQGDEVERYGFADWRFMGLWGMVDAPWREDSIRPILDEPALVEQVRWYVELADRWGVMPREDMNAWTQAAMRPVIAPFQDAAPRPPHFGLTSFPQAHRRGTVFTGLSYIMSAGTAYPQAAWQWLAFLSRQPVIAGPSGTLGIPARRSVVEASGYWEAQPPEVAAACQQALHNLRPAPMWDLAQPAEQAIAAALTQEADLEETLEAAQLQAQAQLLSDRIGPTPTPLPVSYSSSTGPASSAITIKFYAVGPPHRYKEAIEYFEEIHPDIKVGLVEEVVGRTVEPGVILTTLPDVAQSSDCFEWGAPIHESYMTFTLDLEPLIRADPDFSLTDYYPGFLELFRSAGALHGLPSEGTVDVLWYNRKLFDEAGVSYPEPGMTLDQFREMAIRLTRGEGQEKQYGFAPLTGTTASFDYFMSQMDVTRFDLSTWPPRPLFNTPEMARAVKWYTDLILVDGVQPNFPVSVWGRDKEFFENQARIGELISTGRAAMWMGPSSYRHSYSFRPGEFGLAPLPLGQGGSYSPFRVDGYYISANTAHPQACWEWIKSLIAKGYLVNGIPASRTVFESPAYRTRIGEEMVATYEYILHHSSTQDVPGSDGYWERANYWLLSAVDAILEGEPVESALEQAQLYAERYILCLQREGMTSQDSEVSAPVLGLCMLEADPDYPAPSSDDMSSP